MKKGLGKGLGALIPGADDAQGTFDMSDILGEAAASTKLEKIAFNVVTKTSAQENSKSSSPQGETLHISAIEPNEAQPRTKFDEEQLNALASSIKMHGIIQPIIVRAKSEGKYEIVAGERRWRAAKQAKLEKIPVIIRKVDKENIMELALVENLQRVDLNPIDEALGYLTLIEKFKETQEQIAERLGKSRSAIANSLRLLNLPTSIKELIETGDLSVGHAKILASLPSPAKQIDIAEKIVRFDLSVRATENLVKAINKKGKNPEPKQETEIAKYFQTLEQRFTKKFNTNVRIISGKKKRIEIEFSSNKDLDRIIKALGE